MAFDIPYGAAFTTPTVGARFIAPTGRTYIAPTGRTYIAPTGRTYIAPTGRTYITNGRRKRGPYGGRDKSGPYRHHIYFGDPSNIWVKTGYNPLKPYRTVWYAVEKESGKERTPSYGNDEQTQLGRGCTRNFGNGGI